MMPSLPETDRALAEVLGRLDPSPLQVRRMRSRMDARLDRLERSIAAEWLDLVRVRPLLTGWLVVATGCAMLVTTPLASLVWALLG